MVAATMDLMALEFPVRKQQKQKQATRRRPRVRFQTLHELMAKAMMDAAVLHASPMGRLKDHRCLATAYTRRTLGWNRRADTTFAWRRKKFGVQTANQLVVLDWLDIGETAGAWIWLNYGFLSEDDLEDALAECPESIADLDRTFAEEECWGEWYSNRCQLQFELAVAERQISLR